MGSILWIILLAGIYLLMNKKKTEKSRKEVKPNQPGNYYRTASETTEERHFQPYGQFQGAFSGAYQTKTGAYTTDAYPAKTAARQTTAAGNSSSVKPVSSAQKSSRAGHATAGAGKSAASVGTDIVARAKANADRLKADETLKEIEQEHGHSEAEKVIEMDHSRNCQSLKRAEEVELAVENQLGTTEDLIVKGYSGNLSFERDFLGEAMDMLSAISQVPGQ